MDYHTLCPLNDDDKQTLSSSFQTLLSNLKHISFTKALNYLRYIPNQCLMHYNSTENRKLRTTHPKKYHPVKTRRGEIYNAFLTEGVGSELCGNHLVLIMQNQKANIYSEKVNVLPIEGNGTVINPNFHFPLFSENLSYGSLDKNPSRIIITDITTIDKARLGKKIGCISQECLDTVSTLLKKQLEL